MTMPHILTIHKGLCISPPFLSRAGYNVGTMQKVTDIVVHHAGGIGADNYASSAHLTVRHIDRAHQERWNFESRYIPKSFSGYNFIYDPKDRTVTQTRAVGEETAAVRGFNYTTVSICIIGNYNKRPLGSPAGPVDPLTREIEEDVTKFIHELLRTPSNLNDKAQAFGPRSILVAPGTEVSFAESRIHPHRFYGNTACYGSYIDDTHFRDLVIAYRPVVVTEHTEIVHLKERLALYQQLLRALMSLLDLYRKGGVLAQALGAYSTREHAENLPAEVDSYQL